MPDAASLPSHLPDSRANAIGLVLLCFTHEGDAASARRSIAGQLNGSGNPVLDTIVARVDQHGRPRIYDPRRIMAGTVTATITWGHFGLRTGGGISGLISSALLGGLLFGLGGYLMEHVLSKSELSHLGAQLPASSSALLLFTEVHHPGKVFASVHDTSPGVASGVEIDPDLAVYQIGTTLASDVPLDALLSMLVVRYDDPDQAASVAEAFTATSIRRATRTGQRSQVQRVTKRSPSPRCPARDWITSGSVSINPAPSISTAAMPIVWTAESRSRFQMGRVSSTSKATFMALMTERTPPEAH